MSEDKCPVCGAELQISVSAATGERARTSLYKRLFRRMDSSDIQLAPVREHEPERVRVSGGVLSKAPQPVLTPFYIAFITAGGMAVTATIIGIAAQWPIQHIAVISGLVGTLSFMATWGFLLLDKRSIVSVFERATGLDIDGIPNDEQYPQEPKRESVDVNVTGVEGGRRASRYMSFNVSRGGLIEIARAVMSGRSLTEREWTGKGKPFATREDWNEFRDKLIDRGYADWNGTDRRHGWSLTEDGVALFKSLTLPPHSPTPNGGTVQNGA